MTLARVSTNGIALKLSQIHQFSLYLDSAKCNLDENSNVAWVHAHYVCIAQKVKSLLLGDGSTPDAGLEWRGSAIARAFTIAGHCDEWFISKFSRGTGGGRLTLERPRERRIGSILRLKEIEALLGMLSNGKYTLSWTAEGLETICDELELPPCIWLESSHKVWKDHLLCIPKKVIAVDKAMIEEMVRQGRLEPAWGPYRNAHFLVPKKNVKYCFII